jgi:peptidoglycan/LPS O-acetylase OafA/YrhL
LLGALLALVAGVLSYYLLERPARSWLNRRWGSPDRKLVEPMEEKLAVYGEATGAPTAAPASAAPAESTWAPGLGDKPAAN